MNPQKARTGVIMIAGGLLMGWYAKSASDDQVDTKPVYNPKNLYPRSSGWGFLSTDTKRRTLKLSAVALVLIGLYFIVTGMTG